MSTEFAKSLISSITTYVNENATINKKDLLKVIRTVFDEKKEKKPLNGYQLYMKEKNTHVLEFGFIQHSRLKWLGASPDGITNDGIMLEIKCPISRIITGIPPDNYWIQVQGQLEVCDLEECDFLECKIIEYDGNDNEDTEFIYLTDNYEGDYTLNSNGMEKGVIAVYLDKNTDNKIYKYSELGIIDDEYYNFNQ